MCQGQTLGQALDYAEDGHKIRRSGDSSYLEMVKLKNGSKLLIISGDDEDEPSQLWEPVQEDVLATDWVVE